MKSLPLFLMAFLLTACSQTSRLAEGEVLYKGIKEISYGQKARSAVEYYATHSQPDEGVITAVVKAVNDVDRLLNGKEDIADALSTLDSRLSDLKRQGITRQQRDSLQREIDLLSAAYDEARTEVDAALACAPNGSLFGSSSIVSPWPVGLYFHNWFADSRTWVGKWFYNTFAKQPVCLSTVSPATRARVAQNVLRGYGFFNAEAEYDILYNKGDSLKAKVAYSVYPHNLYRLDSIEWRPFADNIDQLIARSARHTQLHSGDPFNVQNLDAERTRLSEMLRDNGYYNFRPEFIRFKADTVQSPGKVQLRIEPAAMLDSTALQQYVIGETYLTVYKYDDTHIVDTLLPRSKRQNANYKRKTSKPRSLEASKPKKPKSPKAQKLDSLLRKDITMYYSGRKGVQPLRLAEFRKRLFYRQGALYRQTQIDMVKSQLASMGVFSQLQFDFRPRPKHSASASDLDSKTQTPQSVRKQLKNSKTPNTPDTLDLHIYAMLDKPYDSEFAANIASKSNGLLGPGLSYSISKKNAFRRAETLKFKVYGSYEWQTGHSTPAADAGNSSKGWGGMNSYELGTQLSLLYPRLVLPGARALNRHSMASTEFSLDASWLNRAGFYTMGQFRGDIAYGYQAHRYIRHRIVPLSLKYSTIMNESSRFVDIIGQRPVLKVSMRDQFVPAMEYTVSTTSRAKAHNPRSLTVTFKQAGNITSGIYAAFGRSLNERDKKLLGVPFAQFVRISADGKYERRFSRQSSLVGHIALGAVYSYGNSAAAPYSDLFYVGGANSIRAFCIRGVGPGRYHPAGSGYSYIDQMGDIKLELNLEYRFPVVGDLYGALFVDAGNVWLMKDDPNRPGGTLSLDRLPRDLALGTGLGLRYDLSFLVIRFDVGVGIHAPYDTGKSGYYNMPHFARSLGYHFAVGYPF